MKITKKDMNMIKCAIMKKESVKERKKERKKKERKRERKNEQWKYE